MNLLESNASHPAEVEAQDDTRPIPSETAGANNRANNQPLIYWVLLWLTCLSVVGVLAKSLIAPASVQRQPLPPAQLLAEVPLRHWQAIDHSGLDGRYEYRSVGPTRSPVNSLPTDTPLAPQTPTRHLTVTVYEMNAFTANSRRFQRDAAIARSFDPSWPQVRRLAGVGSYVLARDRTTTTLTACITPQGKSVGSYEDYLGQTYRQQFEPLRLLAWAAGTGVVRDARCLWITMSMPQAETPPDQAELLLEEAWREWFPRWKGVLPPG
ncbi:MAG: hypothetical protein HC771_01005 [Synechococcales cyanobacterium CRU_2_2]|nr:hypothetical protein [Synechococcales cyanobacterium CRU_2_2]